MRSISHEEAMDVAGGNALLLKALDFVYSESEKIGEFLEGFFEGYEENQQAH